MEGEGRGARGETLREEDADFLSDFSFPPPSLVSPRSQDKLISPYNRLPLKRTNIPYRTNTRAILYSEDSTMDLSQIRIG